MKNGLTLDANVENRLQRLRNARWRGRTDLLWLATKVLGYKDIDPVVHGPIIRIVQQFPTPSATDREKLDNVRLNGCEYSGPHVPIQSLPGTRRRLILDPRGHLKTTLNVICHSIQWILNYPDVAILIVHAKQEVAEDILQEIKSHFLHNRVFREIYPDYCPDAKNAGNRSKFTVPNRQKRNRKESTVATASIETAVSGYHYDVMKFTDVVDLTNSGTREQCAKVITGFGMFRNVLVAPDYWIDVEGTCYDYSDLYNITVENESKLPPADRRWKVHVRGVYKKDTGGQPYTFSPEERELKDLRDERSRKIPWWPARFPLYELESMERDPVTGPLFPGQQLNNPINNENAQFPANLFQLKTAGVADPTRNDLARVPMAYYTTTVDTAQTDGAHSDYSAIVTCGWDGNGRCYVVDARHGRMLAKELIENIFDVNRTWRPTSITIEETAYVTGLRLSIRRQEDLSGYYLPLVFRTPSNRASKNDKIGSTLEPWYKRGEIYFSEKLLCLEHFKKELTSFPRGRTDDLIDALHMQFAGREWFGREVARPTSSAQADDVLKQRTLAVIKAAQAAVMDGNYPLPNAATETFWDRTGGL